MDIQLNRPNAPALGALVYVPGVALTVIGLFVIWNPHLLVYFVGGAFILMGLLITLLLMGLRRLASRGLTGPFGGPNPFGGGRSPFG